jgi:ESS family glutamate:Na+ symporter
MNYGTIYETEFGFDGGKSFGLTIAALGFLSASIGGVVHLNLLKKRGKIKWDPSVVETAEPLEEEIQAANEIPMQGSMDKTTVQIAYVFCAYFIAFLLMSALGSLIPGMRSVIFGFNFLLGVLAATMTKAVLAFMRKKGIMRRQHINNFLMTRISNFFFDIMVVSGIAAIRLGILEMYWGIILVLGVAGLVSTYFYNYYVAKKLFPDYTEEQFLMMFGMLTGTASTGVILLREIDGHFKTPAADNLVYQNFPAIVFGFPMMLLATLAPVKPALTWVILVVFFLAMNVILFRSKIFRFGKKKATK